MTALAEDEEFTTSLSVPGHSAESRPGDRRLWTGSVAASLARPRLLERSNELAEIRQLLSSTWEYPKCPILIEGMSGTGKTALLNASLEIGRAHGLRIGRARCDAAEATASFGVVRQLFSSMFRHQLMPDGPMNDGTDLARRVLRGGLNPTDDPVDVYHSLLLLLETTSDEPSLLGVDDIRWADTLSTGFLQFLARRLTTSSVHLVMTTQAGRAGTAGATDPLLTIPSTRRFLMHPLTIGSATAMINQHLGAPVTREVASRAHIVTGGNPQLIARLLTALDALGDAAEDITSDQIDALASPDVARSVLNLVATLPPGTTELLEAAAVLGECELRVAAFVAGLDIDDAGGLADLLADIGLFGWGRSLELVHPFERRSLYAAIKPARRAHLHAVAARLLADLGADSATVVSHLVESDPSGDQWTASMIYDAARRELEAGNAHDAAQLLERADREGPANPLHAEVVRLRAEVDGRLGAASAVEHLGRAARLGLDPVLLAETALDLLDHARDPATCIAVLDMVRGAGDQLVVRQAPLALRLRLAESVLIPMSERVPHDDTDLEGAMATSPAGQLLTAHRALRGAARMECTHDELLVTLRSSLSPEVLRGSGLVQTAIIATALGALVRIGAYSTADPLIRMAIAEARSTGRRHDAFGYALVLAESLAMRGRVAAAEQALVGISVDGDDVVSQCAAAQFMYFAALRERSGYAPVRVTVIPTSLPAGLAELGASAGMILAEVTARVQLLEGDAASALANFDRLRLAAEQSAVRNPAFAPWRAGRAVALSALGRRKEGAVASVENLQLARAFGSPTTIAEALACAARFQPADVQIDLLHEAVELIAGSDAELLRCNLLIDLGFARHHAGDAVAARSAFRDGADHATRLGVTRLAGVAGRGLLACGARPRRLQMSGVQSLTPAELRVAKLAADGQTNGTIATSLFVNLKTVESHLTRTYKKLGISDRAELKPALEAQDTDAAMEALDGSEAG